MGRITVLARDGEYTVVRIKSAPTDRSDRYAIEWTEDGEDGTVVLRRYYRTDEEVLEALQRLLRR